MIRRSFRERPSRAPAPIAAADRPHPHLRLEIRFAKR
jgi:hypothetical protein